MRTVLGAVLASLLLASCLPHQAKLTRATQLVEQTPAVFNAVGLTWLGLHPCIVDTTQVLHVRDTTYSHSTDTLYVEKASMPSVPDTVVRAETRYVTVHDVVTKWQVDVDQLTRDQDTIQHLHVLLASSEGTVSVATLTADTWERRFHGLLWWEVGIGVFLAIIFIVAKNFKII
jgi:hypothetical protein